MADTLVRDPPAPGAAPRGPVPLTVAGPLAAVGAVVFGLVSIGVVVLVLWAADARSGSPASQATRFAASMWLLAHGTGLRLASGEVSVLPLGLTLLPVLLCRRAGRLVARGRDVASLGALCRLALAVAVPYGLVAALVCGPAGGTAIRPAPLQALAGATLLAGVSAFAGALSTRGAPALGDLLRARLPPGVPALLFPLLRAATSALAAMLAAAAVLGASMLALHAGDAAAMSGQLRAGVVGGAGLVLAGAALLPNTVVWSLAYCLGPGFAVGAGTLVAPDGTFAGAVPALPLLAGLPGNGRPPGLVHLVLAVPVAAGVLAGVVAVRAGPAQGRLRSAGWGGAAGLLAAAGCAALAAASGGATGGGRLATVGPSPWRCGLFAALELVPSAAVAATLAAAWRDRARRPRERGRSRGPTARGRATPSAGLRRRPMASRRLGRLSGRLTKAGRGRVGRPPSRASSTGAGSAATPRVTSAVTSVASAVTIAVGAALSRLGRAVAAGAGRVGRTAAAGRSAAAGLLPPGRRRLRRPLEGERGQSGGAPTSEAHGAPDGATSRLERRRPT